MYVTAVVQHLADKAPGLLKVLREADPDHALVDGTLAESDRVGDGRADYSAKHKQHSVNVQVVTDPAGEILWLSPALPGRTHNLPPHLRPGGAPSPPGGGTRRRGRDRLGKETWPRAEGSRRPVEPGSSSRTRPFSHDAAAGGDLVAPWPYSGGAGPRSLPQAHPHRRSDLLQTRPPLEVDLPARRDDGNRDGRKSFSWRDCRDLLIAAHRQLGGPIVPVWDHPNVHKAAGLWDSPPPGAG